MSRDRALKVVLVVVGLLFTAGVVPLTMFFSREPAVPMIMSIYVTLGIFLLLAVRDPAANRSLIAFGGWANLAHAGVMAAREEARSCLKNELCVNLCVNNFGKIGWESGFRVTEPIHKIGSTH